MKIEKQAAISNANRQIIYSTSITTSAVESVEFDSGFLLMA